MRKTYSKLLGAQRVLRPLANRRTDRAHSAEQAHDQSFQFVERLAAERTERHQVRRVPARVEVEQCAAQLLRAARRPQRLSTAGAELAVVVALSTEPRVQSVLAPRVDLRVSLIKGVVVFGIINSLHYVLYS